MEMLFKIFNLPNNYLLITFCIINSSKIRQILIYPKRLMNA
jgi:hypothetical protein